MADSNISQILAALAAQRPANVSTPGQAPQQPPQGYQGSYVAPPAPAPAVGYSLPKPISSGSLDLSSIKPVNSGSVSLDDAITRAKGYAAERVDAYDRGRGTPLGDRRSQRPRSRSRSPPRGGRDSYRDNYNPYRDERRDDPRRPTGSSYSRDRSFSPNGSDLPNRPPLPSRYSLTDNIASTSYGDDSGSETITIDSNLVGLIIGRQGENLRRVEAETSTRVQFVSGQEAAGPQRQCKITGSRMARESAKAEIARIIAENGNAARSNAPPERMPAAGKPPSSSQVPTARPGEDTMQILVPNRTVGLIIGRGGETIRDIQEKSGCHVNIVGEERSVNGQRPVNLIGSPSSMTHATRLIEQVVMSDTKLPPQDASARSIVGGPSVDSSSGERINDTLVVPSEAVGMIIGKGGETIKDMQTTTGCKINVSQPTPPDVQRDIGLVGTRAAIEDAKRAIMEKVHAVEEKNRSGGGRPPSHQTDQYRQQQGMYSSPSTSTGQYGQSYPAYDQGSSTTPQQAPGADPYQAYGGYENYVRMWYASMAQQQGQAQPQGPNQSYPGSGAPAS